MTHIPPPSAFAAHPPLNGTTAVMALAALGNPTRLQAFRHIVVSAEHGLNVGTLQSLLDTPASTLNHHLNTLVHAGLVRQNRLGREILNTADPQRLRELGRFLESLIAPPQEAKTETFPLTPQSV
ncbi:MAG: helix-turn-helix transcriptional regulator [Rhodospirillaceae bacterium]|nr:helix-turn-helix transcriptional regulator [Rhodospirillaceae bacterium]